MAKRKRNDTDSDSSSDMDSSPTPCRTTLGPQALTAHVTSMLNSIKDMRKDIKRISNQKDKTDDTAHEIQQLATRVEILEDRVTRVDHTVCDAMMRVEGAMTTITNKLLAM